MKLEISGKQITVFSLFGDQGTGKTIIATAMAYAGYQDGYEIYANYDLKGPLSDFTKISDTNFTADIDFNGMPKLVIIDEVGVSGAKTVHSNALVKVMTLVRKLIGEKSIVVMTTPLSNQMNIDLRRMSDFLCYTRVVLANSGELDENGKPIAIPYIGWLDLHRKINDGSNYPKFEHNSKVWEFEELDLICDMYDTGQVAEGLADGTYTQVWDKLHERYDTTELMSMANAVLVNKILRCVPVSKAMAKDFAVCVKHGDDPHEE